VILFFLVYFINRKVPQIIMGKETTRMLCEHARPHSEKLADFIKKKKMETGMYVHPVIKRTMEKRNEGHGETSSPRRASYTFSDSEPMLHEKDDYERCFEDFNDPAFAISSVDTSTKLSITRSGTICAQDYYPSFLMAAESRYEVSTTRNTNTTDSIDKRQGPPAIFRRPAFGKVCDIYLKIPQQKFRVRRKQRCVYHLG
jgi:hypothetical protein